MFDKFISAKSVEQNGTETTIITKTGETITMNEEQENVSLVDEKEVEKMISDSAV